MFIMIYLELECKSNMTIYSFVFTNPIIFVIAICRKSKIYKHLNKFKYIWEKCSLRFSIFLLNKCFKECFK